MEEVEAEWNSIQFQYALLISATSSMQLDTDEREPFYNKMSVDKALNLLFSVWNGRVNMRPILLKKFDK